MQKKFVYVLRSFYGTILTYYIFCACVVCCIFGGKGSKYLARSIGTQRNPTFIMPL